MEKQIASSGADNSELVARWITAGLSLFVVVAVAGVILTAQPPAAGTVKASVLPAVNAVLNATSTLLLILGYAFIRRRNVPAHKTCMITAFVVSAMFLVTYLLHHHQVGSVPFTQRGWLRAVYFSVLIPHVTLSAVVLPLALTTLRFAWTSHFAQHKRLARWTLPIWLYVSVSGVVVYWMLYRLDR